MITIRTTEQAEMLVDELADHRDRPVTIAQTAQGTLAVSTVVDNRSRFVAYIKPDGQVTRPS